MGKIGKVMGIGALMGASAAAGAMYVGRQEEKRLDKMEDAKNKFTCYIQKIYLLYRIISSLHKNEFGK